MLLSILFSGAAADSAAPCDSANAGTVVAGVCVIDDIKDCCDNCLSLQGTADAPGAGHKQLYDCAPNAAGTAHVYLYRGTEFRNHYWFDDAGNVVGLRAQGPVCCNGAYHDGDLECGQVGQCYHPVVSELLAETEPVPTEVCDTAIESPPESETGAGGCSAVPPIGGVAWLLAAALTRRRP